LFGGLVLCFITACARPAPRLQPTALPPVAPVQRLTVQVLVDPALASNPGHPARIRKRIEAASAALRTRFGLSLTLTSIERWRPAEQQTLSPLLTELEALPAADVDLRIGWTTGTPPKRPRMADLVASQYARPAMVLRALTPLFERAPAALHAAEVRTIVHGVAQIFGALPACAPAIMSPTVGFRHGAQAGAFTATNLALVKVHSTLDLRRGTVSPAMARRALALLDPPGRLRCHLEPLRRRRAVLQALLTQPAAPGPLQPVPPPANPTLVSGLTALESGDPQAALERCGPLAERGVAQAARCAGFAAAALSQHATAVRFLRAHLATQPDDDEAVLALSKALGQSGDDGAARALLSRFVNRNPEHIAARLNLGIAAARLGDYPAARAAWAAVLALDPAHDDARALLQQLP
jgi:hypothetical protein